jgi:hypothetical protein
VSGPGLGVATELATRRVRLIAESLIVTAFSSAFSNIVTMFGDRTRYAVTQGITYDFQDAWEQIMPHLLAWRVNRIRDTFGTYVSEELLYWASPVAAFTHSRTVITAMTNTLTDLQTNANTYLALQITAITT